DGTARRPGPGPGRLQRRSRLTRRRRPPLPRQLGRHPRASRRPRDAGPNVIHGRGEPVAGAEKILKMFPGAVDPGSCRSTHGRDRSCGQDGRGSGAKETDMRFLGYTLGDPTVPMPEPTPELFEQMGKFIEEATK